MVSFAILCYRYLFRYRHKNNVKFLYYKEPAISIFVPAHNEEALLGSTVKYLATKLNYHNYEIIICDDGSTDNTPQIANDLEDRYSRVRVIHMMKNAGKAHAYNVALAFARGQFIYSNDADTFPEPDCLWEFMSYFIGKNHRNVGAVTGNIGVINRSSTISKSQIAEFTSIIGGLKSAQNDYSGTQYAFSGASLMIRKDALIDTGGFSQSLDTEDIDLSWRMTRDGWESLFAHDINAYVFTPTSIHGLFHQRLRWAAGGLEVLFKGLGSTICHPLIMRTKIPILINVILSNLWCILYWALLIVFIYFNIRDVIESDWFDFKYMWLFTLVIICFEFICGTIQIFIALHYDNRGTKLKYILFCQLYLVFIWIVNPVTVVWSLPRAILVITGHAGPNSWATQRKHVSPRSNTNSTIPHFNQ